MQSLPSYSPFPMYYCAVSPRRSGEPSLTNLRLLIESSLSSKISRKSTHPRYVITLYLPSCLTNCPVNPNPPSEHLGEAPLSCLRMNDFVYFWCKQFVLSLKIIIPNWGVGWLIINQNVCLICHFRFHTFGDMFQVIARAKLICKINNDDMFDDKFILATFRSLMVWSKCLLLRLSIHFMLVLFCKMSYNINYWQFWHQLKWSSIEIFVGCELAKKIQIVMQIMSFFSISFLLKRSIQFSNS